MMIGRVPCAGTLGVDAGRPASSVGSGRPKTLPAPAAKLLASDVRKNFRRDHSSMKGLLNVRVQYTSGSARLEVAGSVQYLLGLLPERRAACAYQTGNGAIKKDSPPDFSATYETRPETRSRCCPAAPQVAAP